jgi:hypothetical protein
VVLTHDFEERQAIHRLANNSMLWTLLHMRRGNVTSSALILASHPDSKSTIPSCALLADIARLFNSLLLVLSSGFSILEPPVRSIELPFQTVELLSGVSQMNVQESLFDLTKGTRKKAKGRERELLGRRS